MEFDRARIKEEAKARMRQAQPRPWKILLVYTLLTSALPFVLAFITAYTPISFSYSFGHRYEAYLDSLSIQSILLLVFQIISILLSLLLQIGCRNYMMKLWRKEPGDHHDLFRGFQFPGKVIALTLWQGLFTYLWLFLGILAMCLAIYIAAALFENTAVFSIILIITYLAFFFFLFNRVLRYSLSQFLLLDHPEWSARTALKESTRQMTGHIWSYVKLLLSFLGWFFLLFIAMYAILMVGGLLFSLVIAPQLQTLSVSAYTVLLLLILLVCSLPLLPLGLWITGYSGISVAGFYDCLQGKPLIPPAPPWEAPSDSVPFGE